MNTLSVADFMRQASIVKDSDSIILVIKKLRESSVSHVLVVDDNEHLLGIISKVDLMKKFRSLLNETSGKTYSKLSLKGANADSIMTTDPIKINVSDTLALAAEIFLQKDIHCIPVMDNDKIVGAISLVDVMKAYYEEAET